MVRRDLAPKKMPSKSQKEPEPEMDDVMVIETQPDKFQVHVPSVRPGCTNGRDAESEDGRHDIGQELSGRRLWSRSNHCLEPDANGKLTANGWENSTFESAEQRGKFLRLMGGQRFAAAAEAACGDDDMP